MNQDPLENLPQTIKQNKNTFLKNKKILLGVCGSIAAYKSASIIRLLIKQGADVKVIMTPSATQFITPLTLSTLSKNQVFFEYSNPTTGTWNNHVELGLWGDIFLIAPTTANTIASFANGICNNLLTAVYLSCKCPVYIAPAMDLDMWKHPSTKKNLNLLKNYNNFIIQPGDGELASGLVGEGRLAEPEEIIEYLNHVFEEKEKEKDDGNDEVNHGEKELEKNNETTTDHGSLNINLNLQSTSSTNKLDPISKNTKDNLDSNHSNNDGLQCPSPTSVNNNGKNNNINPELHLPSTPLITTHSSPPTALPLLGKTALVTAGPTHEPIDPVRFIGNRSSGKMGYSIAQQLARLGAKVMLVSGPTQLEDPNIALIRERKDKMNGTDKVNQTADCGTDKVNQIADLTGNTKDDAIEVKNDAVKVNQTADCDAEVDQTADFSTKVNQTAAGFGTITLVKVESAQEMFEACCNIIYNDHDGDFSNKGTDKNAQQSDFSNKGTDKNEQTLPQKKSLIDIIVMSAAVADYTPVVVATEKIKKNLNDTPNGTPNGPSGDTLDDTPNDLSNNKLHKTHDSFTSTSKDPSNNPSNDAFNTASSSSSLPTSTSSTTPSAPTTSPAALKTPPALTTLPAALRTSQALTHHHQLLQRRMLLQCHQLLQLNLKKQQIYFIQLV